MNTHTQQAKDWLDRRYSRKSDGHYLAHQPIDGLATDCAEPNAVLRLARTYRLAQILRTLRVESVLDVGGGEGYLAALIRDLTNVRVVHMSDLSVEACQRAGELFGITGFTADSARLPVADASYDLVMCSEVIEHLSQPVFAMGELARVARKYVMISTAEFCPIGELERQLRSWTLDRGYPHAELNWFTPDDFRTLFGDGVRLSSQFHSAAHLLPDRTWTKAEMAQLLQKLTERTPIGIDYTGVVVVAPKPGVPACDLNAIQISEAEQRQILDRLLDPRPSSGAGDRSAAGAVDGELLTRLCCIECGARLTAAPAGLACTGCPRTFEVRNGVPVLTAPETGQSATAAEQRCVSSLAGDSRERGREIRALVRRLHGNEAIRNGARKQWLGMQLLRLLWLVGREEPFTAKITRMARRVSGHGQTPPEVQGLLEELSVRTQS